MVTLPFTDPDSNIDFYAGNDRAYRLMLPLWDELKDRRGDFYVSRNVHSDGANLLRLASGQNLDGFAPLVVSNYKDLHDVYANIDERSIIMLEAEHQPEAKGLLQTVSMFLCKDQRTLALRRSISDNVILYDDDKAAAHYMVSYVKGNPPQLIEDIDNHSVGIVYVAFGHRAKLAAKRSIITLKRLGYSYPVHIIDEDNWTGESPFDTSQRRNFQFRAGRIKPFLHQYTPFEYNLYIDADTRFIKPIHDGFLFLKDHDIALTEEKLSLRELYNKKLAGWELNLLERDTTIIELGGDDTRPFINSGVFFFKQNKKTKKLFHDWYQEWLRFQEWDEQLALMRAIHHNDLNVKYLPVQWNCPNTNSDAYIYHNYGRGDVRINL